MLKLNSGNKFLKLKSQLDQTKKKEYQGLKAEMILHLDIHEHDHNFKESGTWIKRSNLRIGAVEGGTKIESKSREPYSVKLCQRKERKLNKHKRNVLPENSPNLGKDGDIQVDLEPQLDITKKKKHLNDTL